MITLKLCKIVFLTSLRYVQVGIASPNGFKNTDFNCGKNPNVEENAGLTDHNWNIE